MQRAQAKAATWGDDQLLRSGRASVSPGFTFSGSTQGALLRTLDIELHCSVSEGDVVMALFNDMPLDSRDVPVGDSWSRKLPVTTR